MTTINIGRTDTKEQQQTPVYSIPLNTTSAINIQLFNDNQQPFAPSPNTPLTPSASTYIGGSQQNSTPEAYSVVINTDDDGSVKPSLPLTRSGAEPVYNLKIPVAAVDVAEKGKNDPEGRNATEDKRKTTVVSVSADTQTDLRGLSSRRVRKSAAVQHNGTASEKKETGTKTTVVNVSAETQTDFQQRVAKPDGQVIAVQHNGTESEKTLEENKTVVNVSADSSTGSEKASSSAVPINESASPVTAVGSVHETRPSAAASETGSTRSSLPDDTASLTSSGSQGLSASLSEGLMTSLHVTASSNGVIDQHRQRDFIYGRLPSQTDSVDSQLSGSETGNVQTSPNVEALPNAQTSEDKNKKKQPKVIKKKIPLSWDDDEGSDNGSDIKMMDATAFILDEFTEEEKKTVSDADEMKGTRVAIFKGEMLTAMLKVKCSSEEMGNDLRLLMLLHDILVRCDQLGRKMKGSAVRLTPFHLNKMKLDDGHLSKERAAEVARQLDGDIVLCEAVCQKHAERLHIASQIKDKVYEKGPFVVGKLGILVTLWKKHKYAVAAEFSEPLCDHICFYRPHLLGSTSDSALKQKRKATDTVRHLLQSRELLSQMFKTDPTITIAEAARRSFVEIIFYALYD